jgi:proline-specific peptidase
MREETGFIPMDGHRVWYRRVGGGPGLPLLLLHGGPGAGHDYLEPLQGLARDREVIFYDQLGCGRSDRPDDPALWRIERSVREVDTVRQALGLDRIHLLGQSWGGWLGVEYMLSQPRGIAGLVLASTSASIPQFVAEAAKLKAQLPPAMVAVMARCEAAGHWNDPQYLEAVMAFYRRHLCRADPWPDCMQRTVRNLEGNQVYEVMNGPNEFIVIGNLKDWNRIDRLGEIRVPTLITVGAHDELTPACAETLRAGIPGSRVVQFDDSSHTAHIEETTRYLEVVDAFLREVDSLTA